MTMVAKGQYQFELIYPDKHVLHFSLIPPSTQQELDVWLSAISKGIVPLPSIE